MDGGLTDPRPINFGSRGYVSFGFFFLASRSNIAIKTNKLRNGIRKVSYLKYAFYNAINHNIGFNLYSRLGLYSATFVPRFRLI